MLVATYPGAVAAFIGLRWLRGTRDVRLIATNRRIVAAMALVPLAFCAFFFWQAALVALDLVSPFAVITAEVIGSRYTPGARGPGIEHLYTAAGAAYSYPLFVFPGADIDGPRTITLRGSSTSSSTCANCRGRSPAGRRGSTSVRASA